MAQQRLAGSRALITGASGGIGRAITAAYLSEGARVVGIGRSATALRALTVSLGTSGSLDTISADVADAHTAASAVAEAAARMDGLDIVVNAAAMDTGWAMAGEMEIAIWDETIRINLSGTYYICRAALPHLIKSGRGSIVNVTSVAATRAIELDAAYNASKAGVEMLTRTIAREYGGRGVRANCLAPGVIKAGITEREITDERELKELAAQHSLKRLGRAEEVAEAAVWLASAAASFTTGTTLSVDGGYLA